MTDRPHHEPARPAGADSECAAVNTSPEGVWLVDAEWRTTFVSEPLARMLGYVPAEMVGLRLPDLVDESCREALAACQASRAPGITTTQDLLLHHRDGHAVPTSVSTSPMAAADGSFNGAVATVHDLTERRRAEARQRLFEQSVDQAAHGVVWLRQDGSLAYANDAAARLVGLDREALLTQHASAFDVSLRGDGYAAFWARLSSERSLTTTSGLVHSDGGTVPAEVMASLVDFEGEQFAVCFVHDITALRRQQQVMAARLRLLSYARQHTVAELLRETLDEAEKLTGSEIGFYHLVDEDQEQVLLQQWSTNTVGQVCQIHPETEHYPVSEAGVWADCLRERQPVIHNDYASLPHRRGLPEGHAAVVRELVVPVLRGDRVAAILGVGNKPTDYTENDARTISALADLAWAIAEHQRAEEALRASEALLEATQRLSQTGGWGYDVATDVGAWTTETCRIHGIDPAAVPRVAAELLALSLSCYPPGAREQIETAFGRCLSEGVAYDLELPFVDVQGQAKWVRTAGQPVLVDGQVRRVVGDLADITAQKAAEADHRLKSLVLDQTQDLVVVTDLSGIITYVNDAECKHMQRPREELIGQSVNILGQDPARGATQDEIVEQTLTRGIWRGEVINYSADGTEHLIDCRTQLVRDALGQPLALSGVSTDISERKRIEEALRASEAFGRAVLDSLTAHIAVLDGQGKVVAVNDAWRRFATENGCPNGGDHIGADYLAVCAAAARSGDLDALAAQSAVEAVLAGRLPTDSVEYACETPRGVQWFVMSVWPLSGAHEGVVVSHENITDQRRAAQALATSEALHRNLVASLPDMVVRFDRDGRHLFVSDNVYARFGLEADQLLGRTHREVGLDEPSRGFWEGAIGRVVASGEPFEVELAFDLPDGQAVHNLRLVPEFDTSGVVQSVLSIGRDITAHRRVEQDYRTLFREMLDGFALHEILLDDQGQPCDYRFLTVNPAFERQTGLRAADLIGRTVREVMPDIEQHWIDIYGGVALTGEPVFFENRAAGLGRDFEVTAYRPAPGQFACIFTDVTERRRAEDALRESQAMLNLVLETVPQAVFWKDLDGVYLGCNGNFLRAFGLESADQIIGHTDYSLPCPREMADGYRADDREVLTTGQPKVHFEERIVLNAGPWSWVSTSKAPLLDRDGKPFAVLGIFQDVTARKQAEEELRRSKIMLEQTFEQSPVPMVLTSLPDAVLRIINPACQRFLGIDDEPSFIDTCLLDLKPTYRDFAADGHESDFSELPLVRSIRGEAVIGEARSLLRKDGSTAHEVVYSSPIHDANGEPMAALLVMVDITAEKQAEEALRLSEARFRDLLQLVPSVAVQGYAPDGTTQYWNKASEALYGYTAEEAIGRNLLDLIIPPEMRDDVRGAIAYMAETGQAIPSGELSLMRRDGSRVPVYSSHVIVKLPGREQELFCIDVDLTERNRAEQERAALEAQLQQAQKMESVGRLAGGVAHDFNNMLGVILGHTEMALEQVPEEELLHQDLLEVQQAAQRSADLARQLLAFARKQTIAPAALDLNQTVASLASMLARMLGENLTLAWRPSEDLWPVMMDASQLNQMLTNLCVNARDAVADVGTVAIETSNATITEADGPVPPGDWVRLAVSDDGCGMDEEVQSHIFEPFFTTKAVGAGSGLGLATVYGAVRQNGGHIQVESAPGQGTTIAIYLPRHLGAAEAAGVAGLEELVPPGQETILLVEDEPAILRLTARVLRSHGYTVLAAVTPGEALSLARSHPARIHLLLTDVVMPEMNGRDLARQVQSLHPSVRRLFMSGYTADTIAHHGVLEAGVHFIQKPFASRDLLAKVAEVLAAD